MRDYERQTARHVTSVYWPTVGTAAYPGATKPAITADAGVSSGYEQRLWKKELAGLGKPIGFAITVCHMPPGTSK